VRIIVSALVWAGLYAPPAGERSVSPGEASGGELRGDVVESPGIAPALPERPPHVVVHEWE